MATPPRIPPFRYEYTEEEWRESAGHFPLRDRPLQDLMHLHRHWMWANQLREAFDGILRESVDGQHRGLAMLATRQFGFMFVWYGMLWAVIEACIDPNEGRNLDLRGPFRQDIDSLAEILRRCRNAILHVPRAGEYVDTRIQALMAEPQSAVTLRRISSGFGRMFLEEFGRRPAEAGTEGAQTSAG